MTTIFTIGTGNWYVPVAIAEVIAMVMIGYFNPHISRRGRIRTFTNQKLYSFSATVFAVIVCVMVFIESSAGVVGYYDNLFEGTDTSITWSLAVAPFTIMAASFFFGIFLYFVAIFSENSKIGRLYRKLEVIEEERAMQDFLDSMEEILPEEEPAN